LSSTTTKAEGVERHKKYEKLGWQFFPQNIFEGIICIHLSGLKPPPLSNLKDQQDLQNVAISSK
jgi:hypothetical protein